MIRNALKKIPFLTSVLAGLILLIFILFQALPGPEQILSSQRSDGETTKAIVKELGLDQPIYIQAFKYLNDVSPVSVYASDAVPSRLSGLHASLGDWQLWLKVPYLRQSFQTRRLVSSMLGEAFLGTLLLAVSAMLIAVFLGVPLGIWASMRRNSWVDHFIVWISAIGISVPSFFSAMIFSWLFGYVYHSTTGLPMTGSFFEIDDLGEEIHVKWTNLILPAVALGIRPLAVLVQLTRNTMVDIMEMDFIQTARAKGLKESVVIFRHALPNALNPLVTSVGGWFSSLLAGSFFTEYIFQWKGLGKVTIDALQQSDLPLVMGAVLFTACVFFAIHSITEQLYVWIDPRLRKSS
jgi:peptide/nickel transport system permease protein